MIDYQFILPVADGLQPVAPMMVGAPAVLVLQQGPAEARQAHLANAGVVKLQLFDVARGAGVGKMQQLAVVAPPAHYAAIEAYAVSHGVSN